MKSNKFIPICCTSLLMCFSGSAIAAVDRDKDGVADLIDNCVGIHNPLQQDIDVDGFGNRCDADLNNDNITDEHDLELFFTAMENRDLNADFNSDGVVNNVDLSILEQNLNKSPGPSNITPNLAFVSSPPSVDEIQIYTTEFPLENGSNGAGFIHFSREQQLGQVVSLVLDDRVTPFNDAGIEPDLEAGDGIYSSFMHVDVEQILIDEARYLQRLQRIEKPVIKEFSGRALVDERPMLIGGDEAASSGIITLPSGISLIPFPTAVTTISALASTVTPAHSLLITDPSVVADSSRTFDPCDVDGDGNMGNVNGAWSFKTLMRNMANPGLTGITPRQFIHEWLRNWMLNQTVNGFPIAARPAIQNFFPGWDGVNSSTLDMNRLPFRLLAIVNRMDLGESTSYGVGQPGETRFVFGLVDQNHPSCSLPGSTASARQMTVILEYGDVGSKCSIQKNRANAWIDLETLTPLPNAMYNAALQNITDTVTTVNAAPSKNNGSAINQIRTNEIVLAAPWQLREFVLPGPSTTMDSATIKQTPDPGFPVPNFRFGSPVTAAFWEENAEDILCEQHVVPDLFMGAPFLGSQAEYGFGTFWDAPTDPGDLPAAFPECYTSSVTGGTPTVQGAVRHKFSLNTCDDCHSGETNTVFTHVDPGSFPSSLSAFLTGATGFGLNPVDDPGGEPVERSFDDLTRRGQVLDEIATKSCLGVISSSFALKVVPLTAPH